MKRIIIKKRRIEFQRRLFLRYYYNPALPLLADGRRINFCFLLATRNPKCTDTDQHEKQTNKRIRIIIMNREIKQVYFKEEETTPPPSHSLLLMHMSK